MGKRDMTEQEQRLANVTYAAIQQATNSTPRSQQQADFRLGVSNLGHCREYARRMVIQEPFSDVRDKTAAFLGTVVGAAVEAALAVDHPGWVFQADVVFKIPSGGEIAGHPDIIIPFTEATPEFPQGIVDVKTRAELDSVKRNGPSMQQRFQKVAYASAAIDAGYLNPDETIWLYNLWVDRSGIEAQPYVHSEEYHPDMVREIDEWIEDVKYAVTHGEEASRDPSREFCWAYCFAAETEVITRDGVRRIGDLAGRDVELLVPYRLRGGLTPHGGWVKAPVRQYGVQPLMRVTIGRGTYRKNIYATAEHQWFLLGDGAQTTETRYLTPGDRLRSIRHAGLTALARVPFAVAQGFVFGDGTEGNVPFYPNSPKWDSMRDYFGAHTVTERDGAYVVNGTPYSWKQLPDIREMGSYLLSWLAGYFAADGTVTTTHQCSISSARQENVEFVRSVCAIVGVRTGAVVEYMRTGYGSEPTPVYSLTINAGDLPSWFFINLAHASRMDGYEARNDYQWKVVEVSETDRVEPVYCAEVDEVAAFALADGILTHNCEYATACRGHDTDAEGLLESPDVLAAVEGYVEAAELESRAQRLKNGAKLLLRGVNGSTGTHVIRWVEVGPAAYETVRDGYMRLDVRPIGKRPRS